MTAGRKYRRLSRHRLLLANFLFFEAFTRLALSRLESRSGILVKFKAAEGNQFSGKIRLKVVTLNRDHHPKSQFNFQVHELAIDMDMSALFLFQTVLEEAKITGLRGTFKRVSHITRFKPRKSFVVKSLKIVDMNIQVTDTTRGPMPITANLIMQQLESHPFRSKLSIYDILFRSRGNGILEQGSFTISRSDSTEDSPGESRWYIEEIPLKLLGAYMGGPFALISDGSMELEIKSRPTIGKNPLIHMAWDLTIRNVQAKVPENYSADGIIGKMAQPVVNYINEHSREL